MLSIKNTPQSERYTQTRSKEIEKQIHSIGNERKAGVTILIAEKIDFKIRL